MNLTTNDNPLLVAPRPVRLTTGHHAVFGRPLTPRFASTPLDHLDRARISDSEDLKLAFSDKDLTSPRSSPR